MDWLKRIAYAVIGIAAVLLHVIVIGGIIAGLWLTVKGLV